MCGIVGFLDKNLNIEVSSKILTKMANSISHRGPDHLGVWIDPRSSVGLAHRRLSILDLSRYGDQPMHSKYGRYAIVFNGEIYNHQQIRKDLNLEFSSIKWKGSSDTETLLAAIELKGIEKTLSMCVGMFAFAFWDKQNKELILARDRFGEKPLYYGWQNNIFFFGSELKALKAHPSFKANIDENSLSLYTRHNFIPAPYSIYKDIKKLTQGCYLKVSLKDYKQSIFTYWSSIEEIKKSKKKMFVGSVNEAIEQLNFLLRRSVSEQMIADVPLGAFLSGGIDSSTIVALMQSQSRHPIKTFSIGFSNKNYNEAEYAKKIANYLGCQHTELYVTPNHCLETIPKLHNIFDEPFADISQIPTYLVASLAKKNVKVALSGDAGDEIFGGYDRYKFTEGLWKKLLIAPAPLRNFLSHMINKISPSSLEKIIQYLKFVIPQANNWSNISHKIQKTAGILSSNSLKDLHYSLLSNWGISSDIVMNSKEPPTFFTDNFSKLGDFKESEAMMILDTLMYLPDDILCKVDRSSMANSLETRVPFLDHRIYEFAWTLPHNLKLNKNDTKWILRKVLDKYIPKNLIERPKMGFGLEIENWLRGPLKDWAEDLLNDSTIKNDGYFNSKLIKDRWEEHKNGTKNWHVSLWGILMFQQWLKK